MPRVLITVPDLSRPGGVSALFNILNIQDSAIKYFSLHGSKRSYKFLRPLELIWVYIRFFYRSCFYDVIHVNPSMNRKSFLRDGIFVFLAKTLGKRVLVYWHGWDSDYANSVITNQKLSLFFKKTYKKADCHLVLGSSFKAELIHSGIEDKVIYIESNAASNNYLKDDPINKRDLDNKTINILFIARLEKEKGIYQALEVIESLKSQYNVHFNIAGNGNEFENIKNYIGQKGLNKFCSVLGNVSGLDKHLLFKNSDIMLFPTFHKEGMPITILEGMMYGLPILSSKTGGIPDWVESGVNGFVYTSNTPGNYTTGITNLIKDRELFDKISKNNIRKSNELFTPEKVVSRLKDYYSNIM